MAAMKIQRPEIISGEIIKPSLTNHPKIHKLSIFDQTVPHFYVPLLYFYTAQHGGADQIKSSLLKVSLSTALSHYYPLAGKIKDSFTVDCNDDGALFLEAKMECTLSQVLKDPDDEILKLLLPDNLYYKDSTLKGPVAVQVTYFYGGGMSIGLCLCHKIFEMSGMCSFINDWASLARNSGGEIIPEFNVGSLYPPRDLPFLTQKKPPPPEMEVVSRRIVFDGESITRLKAMVADHVPNPTRIEVVTALLSKSAINATSKASSSGSFKPSVVQHSCNLRSKLCPPLSERNKGNIGAVISVPIEEEREVELANLVKEFRKSKAQFFNSWAHTSNGEELCSLLQKTVSDISSVDREVYTCNSWCWFPIYEADFGWGKPLWVASIFLKLKNLFVLRDTRKGGGIEACISMEEEAMAVLLQDEELLSYCSINPSVLEVGTARI